MACFVCTSSDGDLVLCPDAVSLAMDVSDGVLVLMLHHDEDTPDGPGVGVRIGLPELAVALAVALADMITRAVERITAPDDARDLMPPTPTPRDVFGGGRR